MKAAIIALVLIVMSAFTGSAMYLQFIRSKERRARIAAAKANAQNTKETTHARIEATPAHDLITSSPHAQDLGLAATTFVESFRERVGRRSGEILSGNDGDRAP